MPRLDNAEEHNCGTCGDPLEPGDAVTEVWSGDTVSEDGSWEAQNCDIHHSRCVSVEDDRPERHRVYTTKRTGTTHLMERGGIGFRSLCKVVETDADWGDLETVRADHPSSSVKDLCETCARLA